MERERYERYIEPFIEYFGINPKFISGKDIQNYLLNNNYKNNPGLVKALYDYYNEIDAFRYVMLESGTDLRYIQLLLGHKNISTTTIYTRVSTPGLKGIKSPL